MLMLPIWYKLPEQQHIPKIPVGKTAPRCMHQVQALPPSCLQLNQLSVAIPGETSSNQLLVPYLRGFAFFTLTNTSLEASCKNQP